MTPFVPPEDRWMVGDFGSLAEDAALVTCKLEDKEGTGWRREMLREACADAIARSAKNTVAVRCELNVREARGIAQEQVRRGLALANLLPGAPVEAVEDLHQDILACVALWAHTTGRDKASVLVTLTRKKQENLKLHIDHVDARVLCTVFGRGTEFVAFPGWLHAAASFADHDRGGAIADALVDALQAQTVGHLSSAAERQVLVFRGTANCSIRRGQPRFHRGPDVDPSKGDWRLFIKVDDGPGWWRDPSLQFLPRPNVSRQERTLGQALVHAARRRGSAPLASILSSLKQPFLSRFRGLRPF